MVRGLLLFLLLLAVALTTPPARAEVVDPFPLDLVLHRLEGHAARFEQMKARASYTLDGRVERVDASGRVTETKEMTVNVTANGGDRPAAELVRYVEDGRDKTAEARAKRGKGRMSTGRTGRLRLPFLARDRSRYVFTVAERDARDPSRMRIVFVPKVPADDTFRGSAWVDGRAGEVLTMRVTPSKKPKLVDHLEIDVYFDAQTALGRAPSRIAFEASGGFLFIRKHYRGRATLSNARFAP